METMSIIKNDAIDTIFLEQELESISKEVFTKYPEAKYSSLISVDSSDDEGAETVGYLMYDEIGASAIIAEGTTDSPAVDAFAKKITIPVHEIGNHYGYTYRELRNESKAGRSIRTRRASTSARSIEQHHDDICMLADGTNNRRFGGMYGMVFQPNLTKVASPKTFASATNDEILKYFSDMVVKVINDTKGIYEPDTFAMDGELKAELEGRIISGTSQTLWSRIKETYSDMTFKIHYKLRNVGKNPTTGVEGANRVILCYKDSPEVWTYKMPMPYKTFPAINEGRSVRIEASSTSAGVEVVQPLAVVVYHSI